MDVEPIALEGEHVRLEPLSLEEHADALREAGSDPRLFRWFRADLSTPEAMDAFLEAAVAAREDGTAVPFAITRRETGEVIGSTRFGNVDRENESVEIGWTWIAGSHQRTPVNTEMKYLMLRHAFETWECIRVELKTDSRNRRSRAAIERIGATEEGILRQHRRTHQGIRDTVYFSVLDVEWCSVKRRLEGKLARPPGD